MIFSKYAEWYCHHHKSVLERFYSCVIFLRFIHEWHVSSVCSFLLLNRFHCMNIPHWTIHSLVHGHLGCLQVLAITNNAALSEYSCAVLRMDRYLHFSWGQKYGSGIAGPYGKFVFDFVKNCDAVFRGGYSSLPSHQQCTRVSISPTFSPTLVTLIFFF